MKIVVATRNAHKLEEIRSILGTQYDYGSLLEFPELPSPDENADTFEGNAALKARHLANWLSTQGCSASGAPIAVLADDSGLEVDALNGAPGIYSARFANLDLNTPGNSSDAANNAKLLALLREVPLEKRTARFRCVLAWQRVGNRKVEMFEGICPGMIALEPSGKGGFGYDPLFYPAGQSKSFAELGEAVKNQISHRARALEKLKRWLG